MLPERDLSESAVDAAVRACATRDASQISAFRRDAQPPSPRAHDGRRDLREQSDAKQQLGEIAA